MINSEEQDLREGLIYDPNVKAYDSVFWQADSGADLNADTVKGGLKIGDTGLVGSISSFSQYLYGDFEYVMAIDSLSPDSNDSEKYFGLRNIGDSWQRGAAYFDLSYDTTLGDSSPSTRPFRIKMYDEQGNRRQRYITWDTNWGGGGRITRFRFSWEQDGVYFLVNDTVIGVLGGHDSDGAASAQVNTSLPQALRISNRSLDTTDTAATTLKTLTIRGARKVI